MAAFHNDTFTGESAGTLVTSHTPETGGGYSCPGAVFPDNAAKIDASGRVYADSAITGNTGFLSDATPPSANYYAQATFRRLSTNGDGFAGVMARAESTADTAYVFYYHRDSAGLKLAVRSAGTETQLGSTYSWTPTADTDYVFKLTVNGTSITGALGGATIIGPISNSTITSAGKAGVRLVDLVGSSTVGFRIDNFSADVLSAPTTSVLPILLHSGSLAGR